MRLPSASPADAGTDILEREAELAALADSVRSAERRDGRVLLLDGPAGIGKTSLLRAVRTLAAAQDFVVLTAVGSPLDREFPFGLVHQLLDGVLAGADPERRARLLAGSAALAEPVLDPASAATHADPSHGVLHGLYWLCANLAEEQPVAFVVDDLQWGDRSSLRLLEFLGRRLEGLPLLVAGAVRSGEQTPVEELIAALASGPAAQTLTVGPLSTDAIGDALAAVLSEPADPAFVATCAEVTGGNPLLVREVVRATVEEGLTGAAGDGRRVAALAAAGVAGATHRRLASLGEQAVAVAGAATVFADAPRVDDLAALAGLPTQDVVTALDRLSLAGVLDRERAFVHPLVREALAAALPPAETSRLHAAAAARLAARGAHDAAIATHLLATDPSGDPWVAGVLRRAARTASHEGAWEAAISHLRRALAEPPAPEEHAEVLLELGEARMAAGDVAGLETLDEALAAGLSAEAAGRAHAERGAMLLFRDPVAALDDAHAARRLTRDPHLRGRLEAIALEASFYDRRLADLRAGLLEGDADEEPSPVLLAHRAVDAAYAGRRVDEVVAIARGAVADGSLVDVVGPGSPTVNLLALALRHAEEPDLAFGLLDAAERQAQRIGSLVSRYVINHAQAYWHLAYGTLTAAEGHGREALDVVRDQPIGLARMAAAAVLAEVLIERAEADEAAALLEEHPLPADAAGGVAAPDFLSVRAMVRLGQRRDAEALADLRAADAALRSRGWRVPLKGRTALRLAVAEATTGAVDDALARLADEETVARGRGASGTAGIVLLARAQVVGIAGGEAAEVLRIVEEAETLLRASRLRLDLARAQVARGTELRRLRRPSDAREPLREALDLASRLGAHHLARTAREELLATGARPQREALRGPEALTPSERRVAELAASGRSNREIAETLWVSRKTVELHLGNAYGKLGIRSRTQLADALGS